MEQMTAASLAGAVSALATFPDVAFKIEKAIADENSGASDIGDLISLDPALSAAVLRLANSATYNRGRDIASVAEAVTTIGTRELRDLAFGICAAKAFDGVPNDLLSVEDFWRHSLYSAVTARHVGAHSASFAGDSLFTAGLLHDIGHLVMFNQAPEQSRQALFNSVEAEFDPSPHVSEFNVFGFDHSDVGEALARVWNLPDLLVQVIGKHHDPLHDSVVGTQFEGSVFVVHIANSLAVMAELETNDFADAPPIEPRTIEALGVDLEMLLSKLDSIRKEAQSLVRVFVP